MILTKQEILLRLGTDIKITPLMHSQINPNSVNLRLGNELLIYDYVHPTADEEYAKLPFEPLDCKKDNPYHRRTIPESGIVLHPGELYLAQTHEYTETYNLVPVISGRSSIGRLGLCVHVTAGFGDTGFKGHWTLEMTVVRPLRIYPLLQICQVYFHEVKGTVENYSGKYAGNKGVQPSMLWKDYVL